MKYSEILLSIHSQRRDERIRRANLQTLVNERRARPRRPVGP
jgi:hypothetical protein